VFKIAFAFAVRSRFGSAFGCSAFVVRLSAAANREHGTEHEHEPRTENAEL